MEVISGLWTEFQNLVAREDVNKKSLDIFLKRLTPIYNSLEKNYDEKVAAKFIEGLQIARTWLHVEEKEGE